MALQLLFVYLICPVIVMEVTGLYTHAALDYVTGVTIGFAILLLRTNFNVPERG